MSDETTTETAGKPAEPGPVTPLDPADVAHALEATQGALIDSTARAQAAYAERNLLTVVFVRAAVALGCPAWLGPEQEDGARYVYARLATGQVRWTVEPSDLPAFSFLEMAPEPYDGHTESEARERLAAWEPKRG
jgi:hypothetical protein